MDPYEASESPNLMCPCAFLRKTKAKDPRSSDEQGFSQREDGKSKLLGWHFGEMHQGAH